MFPTPSYLALYASALPSGVQRKRPKCAARSRINRGSPPVEGTTARLLIEAARCGTKSDERPVVGDDRVGGWAIHQAHGSASLDSDPKDKVEAGAAGLEENHCPSGLNEGSASAAPCVSSRGCPPSASILQRCSRPARLETKTTVASVGRDDGLAVETRVARQLLGARAVSVRDPQILFRGRLQRVDDLPFRSPGETVQPVVVREVTCVDSPGLSAGAIQMFPAARIARRSEPHFRWQAQVAIVAEIVRDPPRLPAGRGDVPDLLRRDRSLSAAAVSNPLPSASHSIRPIVCQRPVVRPRGTPLSESKLQIV